MKVQSANGSPHEYGYTRAAVNEVFRVALFLVYYLALIGLGAAIMVGAVYAAIFVFNDVLPNMKNGRAVVALAVAAVGLLALAGVFGLYLVKPLFSFTRKKNDERVEVAKADCPRLFDLIETLSQTTGFPLPRHVYLTTDVNACVFYNTSFWSIFLPVRKNLEIGLGLFKSTTIQEVKAVLAHEFGHFGQRSMKIGSAVSVTNVVLGNLIYTDDFIDRALVSWRNSGWMLWRIFGIIASALTTGVKFVTTHVFMFVLRGERKLSRLMEFGADEVACRCAGSEAFISSLCKIGYLAEWPQGRLIYYLKEGVSDHKLPDNFFSAYDVVAATLPQEGKPLLSVEARLKEPMDFGVAKSRLVFTDAMSTHPELADRLDNARELAMECDHEELAPAWSLIPEEVAQKVSDKYFEVAIADLETKPERISSEEFRTLVEKVQSDNAYPLEFERYFDRAFEPFDLQKAFAETGTENPFTEEYGRMVAELETANSDLEKLERIVSGEDEVKSLLYNGIEYSRDHAPVEEHRRYVEELKAEVARRDSQVCSYLCRQGGEADNQRVRAIYEKMEKWQNLSGEISKELAGYDEQLESYFAKGDLEQREYLSLCLRVVGLEKSFRAGVMRIQQELPEVISNDQCGQNLLAYAAEAHNPELEFNFEEYSALMEMRGLVDMMAGEFYHRCHRELARFANQEFRRVA